MKDVNINISVPSEILLTLSESDREMTLEMKRWTALKLYQEKRISIGQCAEIAEMTIEDFIKYLGLNRVSIFSYNNQEELIEDIKNA